MQCTKTKRPPPFPSLTFKFPRSVGFFCSGIPSPRMTLTVPGVTCGSVKLFVVGDRWVGG
jgi:hypothetical protein